MRNGPVLLDSYVPDDATVVERVLDAGAIILGKAVCQSLCFSGAARATPPAGLGRTAAAGEARDEVHDAAQDRPDPIWLGHHRRQGLHPRRAHPARRSSGEAEEEAVQSRLRHLAHHLTGSLAEAKHLYQKGPRGCSSAPASTAR